MRFVIMYVGWNFYSQSWTSSFELKIGKNNEENWHLSAKVLSWLGSKSRLTVEILLHHNKKKSIINLKLELKLSSFHNTVVYCGIHYYYCYLQKR